VVLPPSDGNEDDLAKFFGLLKGFNRKDDIKKELKEEIEDYFEYRWMNDRN
jgi:hypothetical protein